MQIDESIITIVAPATAIYDKPAELRLSELKDSPDPFVSFLAHEIRNPLTNIKLSVDLLELALKDNDLKIYLAIIMRSSVRINEIINEVLKYHGVDEAQPEEHSIHQMLDEVITMAKTVSGLKIS